HGTRALTSSEDEVEEFPSSPARRRSGRLRKDTSPQPARSTRSAPSRVPIPLAIRHSTFSELGSPETSGDDDVVMVTKPTSRRRSKVDIDDPFIVNSDDERDTSNEER